MEQTGIYEQLITKLIGSRLDRDKFYVGERELNSAEASVWLSRFLSNILEFAIESVPSGDDRLQRQIDLSNQLLMWLKRRISDEGFLEENLLDSQGKILTALYELENPVAANLKQYVEDIFPLTGLTQSELFSGSQNQPSSREGVYVIQDRNVELLFVTRDKNEKQFSPTTMYLSGNRRKTNMVVRWGL